MGSQKRMKGSPNGKMRSRTKVTRAGSISRSLEGIYPTTPVDRRQEDATDLATSPSPLFRKLGRVEWAPTHSDRR